MSRTVRSASQLTMFDEPAAQRDMFDDAADGEASAPKVVYKGPPSTREEIHEAMHETIAELRGFAVNPWSASRVKFETGLFRLRAEWFTPDIAEPLQAAFDAEAARLDFANAPVREFDWDEN